MHPTLLIVLTFERKQNGTTCRAYAAKSRRSHLVENQSGTGLGLALSRFRRIGAYSSYFYRRALPNSPGTQAKHAIRVALV
jgi:hypothetical protein